MAFRRGRIRVAAQRQMPGEDSRHGRDGVKRRIVLALCIAVGIGLTLMMPAVQVHSADKEQRFPLLKLEQLNDQQRPFADEILRVSSIGISGPFNMMLRSPVMGQRMFAMLDYLVTLPKPMTSNSKAEGRFGKQDFRHVAAEDVYVCPGGQKLAYYFTTEDKGLVLSRCQIGRAHV